MSSLTHESALNGFYSQIDYVLNQYQNHGMSVSQFDHVIICGLGGSGIGGRIARLAFYTQFPVPVEVISEYQLPAYAGKRTLVILSSYSGNTEETLSMYDDAKARGCMRIVLTSGGELKRRAEADQVKVYMAEAGYQPRMALGYSLGTLLLVLGELSGVDMRSKLENVREMLKNNEPMQIRAQEMLHYFKNHTHDKFVVVCDQALEAVAIRFCQQIQENAKGEAFVSILPEANHNMIESYYGTQDTNFILLNSGLNQRNTLRFHYLKSVLEKHHNRIFEFPINGFSLNTIFDIIHSTDWLSIYISNHKGVDNMVVENINGLKSYLENN